MGKMKEENLDEQQAAEQPNMQLAEMYDLVEKSLLIETDSNQPHYIEVGKAQAFCVKYGNQNVREILINYEAKNWEGEQEFTREIAVERVDKFLIKKF